MVCKFSYRNFHPGPNHMNKSQLTLTWSEGGLTEQCSGRLLVNVI